MRGTRLHGFAAKKHKGSGNRGGKGMSGTGKRADQRKTYVLKYMFPYFGKRGYTKGLKNKKGKLKAINLYELERKARNGEISLPGYKILGEGEIKEKLIVRAEGFSKSAREKIEKAGGKIIIIGKRSNAH